MEVVRIWVSPGRGVGTEERWRVHCNMLVDVSIIVMRSKSGGGRRSYYHIIYVHHERAKGS